MNVSLYDQSEVGRRTENQDATLKMKLGPDTFFLAVADGMGGAAGGKLASESVIKVAELFLRDQFDTSETNLDLKAVLTELYRRCQSRIREVIQLNPELQGMGTTLTCVLAQGRHFVVGNLGDSRVYLKRNGKLSQLTEDHTQIAELMKQAGNEDLDPKFIAKYGHLVTKTLDGDDDAPDFFPKEDHMPAYPLAAGDVFLLCSDGLLPNKGDDAPIHELMQRPPDDLADLAGRLIQMAIDHESSDNISLVLAYIEPFESTQPKPRASIGRPTKPNPSIPTIPNENATKEDRKLSVVKPPSHNDMFAPTVPTQQDADGMDPYGYNPPVWPHVPKRSKGSKLGIVGIVIGFIGLLAYMGWDYVPASIKGLVGADTTITTNHAGLIPYPLTLTDTLRVLPNRYIFELGQDPALHNPLLQHPIDDPTLVLKALNIDSLQPGTYFWRIKAMYADRTDTVLFPIRKIEITEE